MISAFGDFPIRFPPFRFRSLQRPFQIWFLKILTQVGSYHVTENDNYYKCLIQKSDI